MNEEILQDAEVIAVVWGTPGGPDQTQEIDYQQGTGPHPAPRMEPLRFRRVTGGPGLSKEHKIVRILATWKTFEGIYPLYHYRVEDDTGLRFHLLFNARNVTWQAEPQPDD